MTITFFFILTLIISILGSYFLIKADATKLNKDNLENAIIDSRVGSILVFLTVVCIICGFIWFGWKTGIICIVIWFTSSALTGRILKP